MQAGGVESLEKALQPVGDVVGEVVDLVEDGLDGRPGVAGDLVGDFGGVCGDGVGEERAAGGFAGGEVAYPCFDAGAVGETPGDCVAGAFRRGEGVFEQPGVLGHALLWGVGRGGHVADDGVG